MRVAGVAGLALALAFPVVAQGQIFKCVDEAGRVAYQGAHCPAGSEETRLDIRGGRAVPVVPTSHAETSLNVEEQVSVLAQFRLSRPTPFLESNDGHWESAVNAPRLAPGTTVFITGIEGVGNDAWFTSFRVSNDERDFGVISSGAIVGQEESLILSDWPNALAKTSQASTASRLSDNFSALPEYDVDSYCDSYAGGMEKLGVDPNKALERCLSAEHEASDSLGARYHRLPFIISQTCTIESLNSGAGSYEDLLRCVEIKEMYSGDALTFPG
ncbi:MAG TPA: hypothetical protein DDZ35_14780 [Halomonas sp.]|nr:hypothetical protein [Halomonas sp.]